MLQDLRLWYVEFSKTSERYKAPETIKDAIPGLLQLLAVTTITRKAHLAKINKTGIR